MFQIYVLEFWSSKDWVVILKKEALNLLKAVESCHATALRCAQIVSVGWRMARGMTT
jgi:hypothetical protein